MEISKILFFAVSIIYTLSACNSAPSTPINSGKYPSSNSAAGGWGTQHNPRQANDLLISFHGTVNDDTARRIISNQKSSIIRKLRTKGLYQVSIPLGISSTEAIQRFQSLPEIRYAVVNAQRQKR